MRSRPNVWALALAGVLGSAAAASAGSIAIVDQQNLSGTAHASSGLGLGQSFTAGAAGIDAVDLELVAPGSPLNVTVRLRDGLAGFNGLGGAILAVSDSHVVPTLPDGNYAALHFEFASTVALTPGNTYVLELVRPGPAFELRSRASNGTDQYADGQALFPSLSSSHAVFTTLDLVFTTGLHAPVPEPSALALFGIGVAGLVARRRRGTRHRGIRHRSTFSTPE